MNEKIINFRNSKFFKKRQDQPEVDIPAYSHRVSAGMPTMVEEQSVDNIVTIDSSLVRNPGNTAIFTVSGNSMEPVIYDKQKILIDSILPLELSPEQMDGKIVVASVGGDFTVKTLKITEEAILLVPENKDYKVIRVSREDESFRIIGLVVFIFPED